MKKKINWINIFLYLYIILKPFYIGKSGTIQIADLFIVLAFILTMIKKTQISETERKMLKNFKWFILFVSCVVFINVLGFLIYLKTDYLLSTLYYIFILLGIYTIIFKIKDNNFLNKIYKLCMFNIIVQLIIFLIGFGRYFGNIRYMGTFNDPNQFGFFIILMIMLMSIIKDILSKKNNYFIPFFIISCFLIFQSASTGMILAIMTYTVLNFIIFIPNIYNKIKKYQSKIFIAFIFVCLAGGILFVEYKYNYDFNYNINTFFKKKILNSSILDRTKEKVNKTQNENILVDRHLEQIINYPQYLIFGAGQGNYTRFASYYGEIHSTFPSIMFYYGIVPFLILLYWIYKNLKGLKFKQLIPYIAILIESFTLLNQRQLLFWMIIILANKYKEINENKNNIIGEKIEK